MKPKPTGSRGRRHAQLKAQLEANRREAAKAKARGKKLEDLDSLLRQLWQMQQLGGEAAVIKLPDGSDEDSDEEEDSDDDEDAAEELCGPG